MKRYATLFTLLLSVCTLFAGADGTAFIKGKSGSGRTSLELQTRDIDQGVKYLKFTIDGQSYEFNVDKEKDTYAYHIHDSKHKVFTVFIDNKQIDFKFWIIPSSLKKSIGKNSEDVWTFEAYVEATDPRQFNDATRNHPMAPRVHLVCTLNYSI